MEIFLTRRKDYMACGLPRKSEKDRKAWSSRGAKRERCTKEGGSIRRDPEPKRKASPAQSSFLSQNDGAGRTLADLRHAGHY